MTKKIFLSYFKYTLWIILWLFFCYASTICAVASFDLICFEFTNQFIFLDYTIFSQLPMSFTLLGLFYYIFFKCFNWLTLYIYSYKVYRGKYNWFKFFREKQKIHDKEDREEYILLVKQEKEKRKNKDSN